MKKFSVKKSEKMTEKKAEAAAKKNLKSSEGTIEPCHTETHWVFKKIRE